MLHLHNALRMQMIRRIESLCALTLNLGGSLLLENTAWAEASYVLVPCQQGRRSIGFLVQIWIVDHQSLERICTATTRVGYIRNHVDEGISAW